MAGSHVQPLAQVVQHEHAHVEQLANCGKQPSGEKPELSQVCDHEILKETACILTVKHRSVTTSFGVNIHNLLNEHECTGSEACLKY